jgi:transcription initiation factor TFIIIB Brf1 subunit/transcription initiation factor TFIIB
MSLINFGPNREGPQLMATVALYMACRSNKRRMTQKLADAAGISTVFFRNRLRELETAFSD